MADSRKLRFMHPRGYNGAIIARGALVEIAEPWASRFIADGTAEEVAAKPKEKSEPKPAAKKPAAKKKKS